MMLQRAAARRSNSLASCGPAAALLQA